MKDKFFLALGIFIVASSFYFFLEKPAPEQYQAGEWRTEEVALPGPILKVGEVVIPVELADTNEKRNLGLSGRESLGAGTGLLFLFDSTAKHGFWMKDMNFPIDIVWLDENWKVVTVKRDVKPESYPTIFYPDELSKYVLELNSGDATRLGIDRGIEVSLVK